MLATLFKLCNETKNRNWAVGFDDQGFLFTAWGGAITNLQKFQQIKAVTNGKDLYELIKEKTRKGYEEVGEIEINPNTNTFTFAQRDSQKVEGQSTFQDTVKGYSILYQYEIKSEHLDKLKLIKEYFELEDLPQISKSGEVFPTDENAIPRALYLLATGSKVVDHHSIFISTNLRYEEEFCKEFKIDFDSHGSGTLNKLLVNLGLLKRSLFDLKPDSSTTKESDNDSWF